MRFKRLDLNLLVALDHMLALRSVSATAEKMHLSQSAMSNALTRLRTYFDDPLLVPVGRRMELTPKAEAMRAPVRDILVRIEATIESEPAFDPATSNRTFGILLSDYTLNVLVPFVLATADREGATVAFNFLPQTDRPYMLLDKGEADLLIAPETFAAEHHPSELLFEDRYVCLVARDGPLGDAPMTEARYLDAGHVVMVPLNNAWSLEAQRLSSLGVERRVEVRSFSFFTLPALVSGTGRVATVHELIARKAVQTLPLQIHALPFDIGNLPQVMQWHDYRANDPGIIWLKSLFRRAAAEMLATLQ